jgi:hypothetical protein
VARTLAGINTTARSRTPISIPKVETVEELRKVTEKTLNQHADQANKVANILQNDLDAGGFKIQNLGNPTANKDAVPLDFLKKSLQNITIRGQRGGGGADQGLAHFGIAIGFPVATATDVTAHHIVSLSGHFQAAYINSKLGPTGSDLIIDLQLWNGSSWASIFGATKLVLPAGATDTDLGTQTTFAITGPAVADLIRADVTQIGSTFPGQDISVMLRWS